MSLGECPPSLKQIQHYLKVAQEHETRNPVVCYWSQFYALQSAIPLKANDNKAFLLAMMDHLEKKKKELSENEAITNEVVAQAHIENYALKLFSWADTQDRQENFNKNVVKAFYTAGMLFDVLTTFGELSEEIQQNRKYAKWKAAYIHNCLKNGEKPVPGPLQQEGEDGDELGASNNTEDTPSEPPTQPSVGFSTPSLPQPTGPVEPSDPSLMSPFQPPAQPTYSYPGQPAPQPGRFGAPDFMDLPSVPTMPTQPVIPNVPTPIPTSVDLPGTTGSNVVLSPEQMTKAQKYCKYAGSALNYDDVPTAISYLEKALKLCKTGIDS